MVFPPRIALGLAASEAAVMSPSLREQNGLPGRVRADDLRFRRAPLCLF